MSEHPRSVCAACGSPVAEGQAFCPTCGHPQTGGGRRGFAAAPGERRHVPRMVSSLFPHLAGADHGKFRLALGLGGAAVLGLTLAGLFSLAVVAGAVLVPIVTLLYLYDVDVYEGEPATILAFTVLWGVVAGVVVGLAGRVGGTAAGPELLRASVVLPLVQVALALGGPLTLLPGRRFNDVLDGTTFGMATGVALAGAATITAVAPLLSRGFQPAGRVAFWIPEVFVIAIGRPVLLGSVTAAAAGALWLRYRAPARDRRALGALGHPAVAIPLAAAAEVAAGVAQTRLDVWPSAIVIALLAGAALVWLRLVIHVGLIEESREASLRMPVPPTCPNCGHPSDGGTFCSHCGMPLLALPKHFRTSSPSGEAS